MLKLLMPLGSGQERNSGSDQWRRYVGFAFPSAKDPVAATLARSSVVMLAGDVPYSWLER